MPRIRSLITTVEITSALRAHNCQGDMNHRIVRGDRRLAVKKDRAWDYYCLACGVRILKRDATKIAGLLRAVEAGDDVIEES